MRNPDVDAMAVRLYELMGGHAVAFPREDDVVQEQYRSVARRLFRARRLVDGYKQSHPDRPLDPIDNRGERGG